MKISGHEIQLLILDVDGVLTRHHHIVSLVKKVAEEVGLPVKDVTSHFRKSRKGAFPFNTRFRDDVHSMWPHLKAGDVSRLLTIFRQKERESAYEAYDGVNDFLEWLHNKGVILAICTRNNHEALSLKLAQACINEKLFTIKSVPGKYAKPDPRCVQSILNAVAVKKEHVAFVGDWFPDLNAARHAGVMFIATTCGVLSRKAFVDVGVPQHLIIDTLPHLRELITQ